MEGLEATEVYLSRLERTRRIDAEFFQNRYIDLEESLSDMETNRLTSLVDVTDGNHFSISSDFVEVGIPYYRGKDVTGPFFAEQSHPNQITAEAFHAPHMQRSHLKKGDVLLSIVGTVGALSLVDSNRNATCSCKLAIFRPKIIEPEFLAIYLESDTGALQIQRFRRGTVQTGFLLEDIDQILVPNLSQKLRNSIVSRVRASRSALEKANSLQADASDKIANTLGLAHWTPSARVSYAENLSTAIAKNRLDAEFFQPKYVELETKLTSDFELAELDSVCTVTKGRTVPYAEDGDVAIIRSGDLHDISNPETFLRARSSEDVFYLKKGDVLVSSIGKGSIGKVQVFDIEERCGTVSEVTVIRPSGVNPYFLCAYLRSIAGQLQIERWITGATGQLHLYSRDVKKITVPLLKQSTQTTLQELFQESAIHRASSKILLERAKRAVEIAIEQDEETAFAYLDSKHYVAEEILPKLFGLTGHYVDLETIQSTIEKEGIDYEPATVNRYLIQWGKEGRLHDAGRGWYSDLPNPFVHNPQIEIINRVIETMDSDFPLLDQTIWSTRELTPYFHHLPSRHATFLMVDRDALDPVADALIEAGFQVANHPLGDVAKKFSLASEDTIILRPRLSSDHTETRSPIEHTLVDLYHEIEKLALYDRQEYGRLARNLTSSCRINIAGLSRYAKRRKIDADLLLKLIL